MTSITASPVAQLQLLQWWGITQGCIHSKVLTQIRYLYIYFPIVYNTIKSNQNSVLLTWFHWILIDPLRSLKFLTGFSSKPFPVIPVSHEFLAQPTPTQSDRELPSSNSKSEFIHNQFIYKFHMLKLSLNLSRSFLSYSPHLG